MTIRLFGSYIIFLLFSSTEEKDFSAMSRPMTVENVVLDKGVTVVNHDVGVCHT